MRLCAATTRAGEQCKRPAQGHGEYCLGHDPTKAAERRRMASRGGRGRINSQARAVRKFVDELTPRVLSGEVQPSVVHAVVALQNAKLRAIEVERKLEESDVIAEFENLKAVLREHGIALG